MSNDERLGLWREIKDALIEKLEREIMEWNNCDPELGVDADSDIDNAFEHVWALAEASQRSETMFHEMDLWPHNPDTGRHCLKCTTEKQAQRRASGIREQCKANPTADPPQDCDFPFCGCFEMATKTVEALQECGWGKLERSETSMGELDRRCDCGHLKSQHSVNTGCITFCTIDGCGCGMWRIEIGRLRTELREEAASQRSETQWHHGIHGEIEPAPVGCKCSDCERQRSETGTRDWLCVHIAALEPGDESDELFIRGYLAAKNEALVLAERAAKERA